MPLPVAPHAALEGWPWNPAARFCTQACAHAERGHRMLAPHRQADSAPWASKSRRPQATAKRSDCRWPTRKLFLGSHLPAHDAGLSLPHYSGRSGPRDRHDRASLTHPSPASRLHTAIPERARGELPGPPRPTPALCAPVPPTPPGSLPSSALSRGHAHAAPQRAAARAPEGVLSRPSRAVPLGPAAREEEEGPRGPQSSLTAEPRRLRVRVVPLWSPAVTAVLASPQAVEATSRGG